ncbi:hypothetical protein BDZ94DRAFT_1267564 [Collybia nuda]|uniref:F-box domain-containing protein n=1 Tax=Collybia nuda TaxID=64659 RepID=A0A9P6CBP7_9AGAR|nr:hypothetical protein BDZ94DRAFT_1267564 [Collybia nuda]
MLSTELWTATCRFLNKKDLAQLSCTSSKLLDAARPVLYRSVHLHTHEVVEIHFITEWQTEVETSSWLDLGALSNLAHLRSMSMTASPFQTTEEQQSFLKIINRSCPLLKEFAYRQCRYASPPFLPSPHPTSFPSDNFEIYGLEKLTWDDNACFSAAQPQLRSLVNASLPTISHMALPSPLDDFGVMEAITFYQEFRLPCLKTFAIGDWVNFKGGAGPVALVEFLIAHPTIQVLSLDWEDTSEYTPELSSSAVTWNMLPNLRNMHCHVFNILVLLRGGVRALANLTKLSVGHGLHPDAESQMDEMFEELNSIGGLPYLKTLHFDPGESCCDPQKIHRWILQWSKICPGLTKWSGTLPDMELDELISDFIHFSGLTRVGLAYTAAPRGVDDIIKIATQLSSLNKITIQPSGKFNIRRITYHVQRNDHGTVSQLIIRKYNLYNHQVTTIYHNLV